MRLWIPKAFVTGLLAFAPSVLFAQRGASHLDSNEVADQPNQGVPGYFDSNLVRKGGFSLDLPTAILYIPLPISSLDYGLNHGTTVGFNPAYSVMSSLAGGYGLALKVRTLVFGNRRIQSVATAYAGMARFNLSMKDSVDDEDLKNEVSDHAGTDHMYVTSNTTWLINSKMNLTGQLSMGRLGVFLGDPASINHSAIDTFFVFLGGQYRAQFKKKYGMEFSGMFPLYSQVNADSVGGSQQMESANVGGESIFFLARGSFEWVVKEICLMNIGLAIVGSGAGAVPLPWYGAAFTW